MTKIKNKESFKAILKIDEMRAVILDYSLILILGFVFYCNLYGVTSSESTMNSSFSNSVTNLVNSSTIISDNLSSSSNLNTSIQYSDISSDVDSSHDSIGLSRSMVALIAVSSLFLVSIAVAFIYYFIISKKIALLNKKKVYDGLAGVEFD